MNALRNKTSLGRLMKSLNDGERARIKQGAQRRLSINKLYPNGGVEKLLAYHLLSILEAAPAGVGRVADPTVWEETPKRWVKALKEMTSGYQVDVPALFKTFENTGYDGMVVLGPIPFWSLCEHHLLPFHGSAWVGYLPGTSRRIVGLSKLARLVDAHARRLQVQERLTADIASDLRTHLKPAGVGVRIESVHTCMCARGIKKEGVMRTQTLLGEFREGAVNGEFNSLINRGT